MPRIRVNRQIHKTESHLKGKWLINLQNGKETKTLHLAINEIRNYLDNLDAYLYEVLDCYGKYVGEAIDQGGIIRQPSHWDIDVQSTR
jgi:hypothetical protein